MGQEDVGGAIHPEVVEVVEHVTAAEVHEDGLATRAQHVDVDSVGEAEDVRLDLHAASLASASIEERRFYRCGSPGPRGSAPPAQNASQAARSPGISVTARMRMSASSNTRRLGWSRVRPEREAVVRTCASTIGPPLHSSDRRSWLNEPSVSASRPRW